MRRQPVLAALLLLSGVILYAGSTGYYTDRATVLHEEQVDPYRTPSFNVSIPHPDRVTQTRISVDIPEVQGRHTVTVRFNGVEMGRFKAAGSYTVTLGQHDAATLREQNTLTIEVQQHFGTEPLSIDSVTVTAPTRTLRWTTAAAAIIGAIIALYSAYLAVVLLAGRFGYGDAARSILRRMAEVVIVIGVFGVFFSLLNGTAFLIIEEPVTKPLLASAEKDVRATARKSFQQQYDTVRHTTCVDGFGMAPDCTMQEMTRSLQERTVATYTGMDQYFRDAMALAYLHRFRALATTPMPQQGFEPVITRLLSVAWTNAAYILTHTWTNAVIPQLIDRCRANDTGPRMCFDRARAAFTASDRPPRMRDPCPQVSVMEAANLSHEPAGNWVVGTYLSLIAPRLPKEQWREMARSCPSLQGIRSEMIREVYRVAYAMSSAAMYSAAMTTQVQRRTRQLGDAMMQEVSP